jgi:non-canonical (house-cleaning) NTP pyrophosphatase
MEDYAKIQNVRKHEGAVGIFTNGLITRVDMFTHVMNILVGQFKYKQSHPY